MNAEESDRAREAWWAMLHDVRPMPAAIALDYVQDVSGEREEAAKALSAAAADYLRALAPSRNHAGERVCELIAAGRWSLAAESVLYAPIHRAEWYQWGQHYAPRVAAMCRAIAHAT